MVRASTASLVLTNSNLCTPGQDLLKHTPSSHPDHSLLQDALRISQNFLSSINEEITPRRQSMTVKKGEVSMAGGRGGTGTASDSGTAQDMCCPWGIRLCKVEHSHVYRATG